MKNNNQYILVIIKKLQNFWKLVMFSLYKFNIVTFPESLNPLTI